MRVLCLLALCQTHSAAHLLISYCVFMSLNHSFCSLSLTLAHPIVLCVYIAGSISACDYVQAGACSANLVTGETVGTITLRRLEGVF